MAAGYGDTGHILVVDDEECIREMVEEYLSREGYRVSSACNGNEMRRVIAEQPVDLVLLDLMLPGEDGLALARSLREETSLGIIILSGRGETIDRIIGLEMGSDDYLPKPFAMRELSARVKSVLRRVRSRTGEDRTSAGGRINFGGWTLHLASRELRSPAGEAVRLTSGEFDLLAVLVENANKVVPRERLAYLTRGRELGPFDRSIDVLIGRLRRKLQDDPHAPHLIKMVRGIGYILTPLVDEPAGSSN